VLASGGAAAQLKVDEIVAVTRDAPDDRHGWSRASDAYPGPHQLCAPLFDRLEPLPAPQRDVLARAFGLAALGDVEHRSTRRPR
jgi:hypothetical protein